MIPSRVNSREYQRQTIDTEIRSLEGFIRALKLRRNALAPISSLPPEVLAAIFSFVRLPNKLILAEEPDKLACLRVSHVCHQWREIALNQPLLWSHIDFTLLTSAGAAEMLVRAKTVPLHLEANVPIDHWDNSRFGAFQKELRARASHIYHLSVSAEYHHLSKILEGLVSPAPTLEDLSLSTEFYEGNRTIQSRVFVPDNIFDGTTPRLFDLVLKNCDISWNSPLLKGLRYLEIRTLSASRRPSLSVWSDALDQIPQLKTLTLHSASPIAPPFSFDVERTVTLPSLVYLDIAASARDCGFALAHLVLPALTWLGVVANSSHWDGGDVQEILPYVSRHAHGPRDDQPLQSVFVNSKRKRTHILAWTEPDMDREVRNWTDLFLSTHTARVSFAVTNENWFPGVDAGVFDAAMAALPLDNLVTLTAQNRTRLFEKQVWLHHAPRWPLLQSVRLAPQAARGLREMFLEDSGNANLLLPSLRKLVLINTALSAWRTLRLRDAFMKRVEQGVPLVMLNLHTCPATSRAVELLREIVGDVWGPVQILDTREQMLLIWDSDACGLFVPNDDSGVEDNGDDSDYSNTDDDDDRVINYDEDEDEEEEEEEEEEDTGRGRGLTKFSTHGSGYDSETDDGDFHGFTSNLNIHIQA
ncbi:hypothetical protein EDB89DRAFT_755144 [Lactarius sanguifluus]|nr:hypothetical protein EDB89DRAFT_755144 [Lactarius sanguifluus]